MIKIESGKREGLRRFGKEGCENLKAKELFMQDVSEFPVKQKINTTLTRCISSATVAPYTFRSCCLIPRRVGERWNEERG